MKNKEKTLEAYESSSFAPQRKRLQTAAHSDVEDALLIWFKQAQSLNVPISGSFLQMKARELAHSLWHTAFACSTGWFERFKARHGIVFRKMSGESASVTSDMTADWLLTRLPYLLDEFRPDDIFSADETGLFCQINHEGRDM